MQRVKYNCCLVSKGLNMFVVLSINVYCSACRFKKNCGLVCKGLDMFLLLCVNNHLVRRMTAAGTDGATQPRIQQRQMYINRKNIAANVERRKQPKFPNPLRLLTLGEVTVILSRAKININYHNKAGHSPLISRCCQHKNPYAALLWQHIFMFAFWCIKG